MVNSNDENETPYPIYRIPKIKTSPDPTDWFEGQEDHGGDSFRTQNVGGQGAQGAQGATGAQGSQGAFGGPQGPQGPSGDTCRDTNLLVENTACGFEALLNVPPNTDGSNYNSVFGYRAMKDAVGASTNVAIGAESLQHLTVGQSNIAIGYQAMLASTTSASYNIAIGNQVMAYGNGAAAHNVLIGHATASSMTVGAYNTAVGDQAMTTITAGTENTAVGAASLNYLLTTTDRNTAIGVSSGQFSRADSLCTFLGYGTGRPNGGGGYTNSTAVGANATLSGSNQIVLGDANNLTRVYTRATVYVGRLTDQTFDTTPSDPYLLAGRVIVTKLSGVPADGSVFRITARGSSGDDLELLKLTNYTTVGPTTSWALLTRPGTVFNAFGSFLNNIPTDWDITNTQGRLDIECSSIVIAAETYPAGHPDGIPGNIYSPRYVGGEFWGTYIQVTTGVASTWFDATLYKTSGVSGVTGSAAGATHTFTFNGGICTAIT